MVGEVDQVVAVLRSSLPQARWIMMLEWFMLRKPLTRVLTCWMMPFRPSRIALAYLATWNLSMTLAALGKWSRMPLANPRPMSHVTRRTRSGPPLRAMKSSANRSTVCASPPGATSITLRSAKPAATVMRPSRRRQSPPLPCGLPV